MLWSRKTTPVHEPSRVVGIDLTASRVRVVSVGGGRVRPLTLDGPAEDLVLFLACDRRPPEPGRAGYALSRRVPHAVVSNFLASLAQPREFRAGRHVLTAESALELVFARLRDPVAAESDAAALVLPGYLAPGQVTRAVVAATRAKLPLKGTAAAPLAVAAHRASVLPPGRPVADTPTPAAWRAAARPGAGGSGSVVLIDADEFALSATVVTFQRDTARLAGSGCWPAAGIRAWKERLLDAVSDRCVRLCRRDPRDSAEAEQALFEQLDDALDRARAGQRVCLTVRTAHWYQDVEQQPEEFDGYCAALARLSADGLRDLTAGLPVPPRAVWLTHAAGRLPGLARMVHQYTPEGTAVEVLPPGAVAHAAAALVPRWLTGELPRTHLDTTIPLPPGSREPAAEQPKPTGWRS